MLSCFSALVLKKRIIIQRKSHPANVKGLKINCNEWHRLRIRELHLGNPENKLAVYAEDYKPRFRKRHSKRVAGNYWEEHLLWCDLKRAIREAQHGKTKKNTNSS